VRFERLLICLRVGERRRAGPVEVDPRLAGQPLVRRLVVVSAPERQDAPQIWSGSISP
jgi:hypothetical protein